MIVHLITTANYGDFTGRCGQAGKQGFPEGHHFSGWESEVNCPACCPGRGEWHPGFGALRDPLWGKPALVGPLPRPSGIGPPAAPEQVFFRMARLFNW